MKDIILRIFCAIVVVLFGYAVWVSVKNGAYNDAAIGVCVMIAAYFFPRIVK